MISSVNTTSCLFLKEHKHIGSYLLEIQTNRVQFPKRSVLNKGQDDG
jgi:hypothetical protein